MRMLKGYPELRIPQQEMIRTMRQITATDAGFLHELVTHFVDFWQDCPKPHDLRDRAGVMRTGQHNPTGSPSCLKCHGTGWHHFTKTVKAFGIEPYEAEFSIRCHCAS